jgi:phosphoglycerate dehydrogenase-like enzyme
VFDEEPLPAQDALRNLPNVSITPHLGFVTEPVFQRFVDGVTECLQAWLTNAPLPRISAGLR